MTIIRGRITTTAATRAILMLALPAAGCGPPDNAPNVDGTWVGTITTEGSVTTVVNESGSVWGGTATLVEEASIGVELGADEYMFGDYYDLNGLAASASHVYVIDVSVPLVRTGVLFVVTKDGIPFGPQFTDVEWANGEPVLGMVAHGPEGPFGTPRMPPPYDVDPPFEYGPNGFRLRVRHAPDYVWRMTAAGEMIGGASTSYQFTRTTADGATTRIERKIEPRPGCMRNPDEPRSSHCWRDTWILDAFDQEGRYLGEIGIPPGATAAMLTFARGYMDRLAVVRGDLVILREQDESGTVMVKRYRLVLPGEAQCCAIRGQSRYR